MRNKNSRKKEATKPPKQQPRSPVELDGDIAILRADRVAAERAILGEFIREPNRAAAEIMTTPLGGKHFTGVRAVIFSSLLAAASERDVSRSDLRDAIVAADGDQHALAEFDRIASSTSDRQGPRNRVPLVSTLIDLCAKEDERRTERDNRVETLAERIRQFTPQQVASDPRPVSFI